MVKEIPITKGQISIVDDIDFDYLNQNKWQTVKRNTKSKDVFMAQRTKHLGVFNGKEKRRLC